MVKTVFIGSVISSKVALETLIECGIRPDLICSLDEDSSLNVSDYYPIHNIAKAHDLPFVKFNKINRPEIINSIQEVDPDYIFVFGLSQIISEEIINSAKKYAIGFHPTSLPKFRGRAALPWQIILGVRNSMVTIFKIDNGMDSGDIIHQYPYLIDENDYAIDVYNKVCDAMKSALIDCVPWIIEGNIKFVKQDHDKATYLLVRRPEDGEVNWNLSGKEIQTLIRATSHPYPGAFAYYKEKKVIFWEAELECNQKYIGIPGQIASLENSGEIVVVLRDSLLRITKYQTEDNSSRFLVGHKFE